MTILQPIKPIKKARIGLYTIGLAAYWKQFPGLRERLLEYGRFMQTKMSEYGEVVFLWPGRYGSRRKSGRGMVQ